MKVAEKFDKWEKLWQDGKNEYLRKSHVSTEILRTILTKGKTGKTLYRIIDSDDRLFYEGIVNLRITCTTSDIDKLMYISNGVGRKSVAVVEFSKDTLSYEMQKTDSKWTDESEHLTFGKFKVSKKSDEIYITGCDIPLIHFYAEPIDQSVDYAKKLIQKRVGHYKEDPLAKQLNDEAILKMFNESTNYNMSKLFENILQEGWTEDQAAQTFSEYSKIRGYDAKEDLMQFAYYGSNSNFKRFAVNVAKLLPKECDLKIGTGGMAITVTYKGYGVGEAYRSVNDREVHCFNIEKPVIRFGIKNGSLNTEGAAKRFVDYLQPNITKAEIKAQEHEAREIKRNANADRIKQVRPDAKDLQRARDAWGKLKGLGELRKYYDLWRQQNDKITDTAKADRRVNAFYNFFLSQEPNIPESYKSEFNRIKARFEDRMKDINLHESVNSEVIFDKVLKEDYPTNGKYIFVPHGEMVNFMEDHYDRDVILDDRYIGYILPYPVIKKLINEFDVENSEIFEYPSGAAELGIDDFARADLEKIGKSFFKESTDLIAIYDNVLKEGSWTHSGGYVPHDGNGMVGGKWESSSCEGEYEKDVVFKYEGKEYTVKMTLDAELDGGYDDSVNYSWADVDIDEDSIQIKDVCYWDEAIKDYVDVENPDPKIIEAAKKEIIDNANEYFEDDWEQDEPDYPDYDPDD